MSLAKIARALQAYGLMSKKAAAKTKRISTIQCIGDSIPTYQGILGLTFAAPVNVTGVELRGAGITCPTGNATLAWDATAQTLTWTAPTDTAGAAVSITGDGHYDLPSGTAGYGIHVGITFRALAGTNKSDTLASSTRYWRRGRGSFAHIIDALTNRRFTILRDMGIGGCYTSDVLGRYPAAITAANVNGPGTGIIIDESGTNDIVAAGYTSTTVATNRAAAWDLAAAAGTHVLAYLISPRFGVTAVAGAAGGDSSYSAARMSTMVDANRKLLAAAASKTNVTAIDNWTSLADPATGKIRNYSSSDGLHPAGDMGVEWALPAVAALNVLSPPGAYAFANTSAGAYYDATYNLGGNLLATNLGAFASTGGTAGTGVAVTPAWVASTTSATANVTHVISNGNLYRASTTGTAGTVAPAHNVGTVSDGVVDWVFLESGVTAGIAASWTVGRTTGAALSAWCHKVTSTDSGPDWQEFILYGAAANEASATAEEMRFFPTALSGAIGVSGTLARIAVGDTLDSSIQMQVLDGAGCYGVYSNIVYTGGLSITHDNQCLKDCHRGLRFTDQFTLALEPIVAFAGITNLQPLFFIQSKLGGVFRVRVRNADIHRVV